MILSFNFTFSSHFCFLALFEYEFSSTEYKIHMKTWVKNLKFKHKILSLSYLVVRSWFFMFSYHLKRVFGSAVEKIDFDWIDFTELILDKNEFNVKWFMFGYLYNRSDLYEIVWIFCVKIAFRCGNDQNGF